MKQLTRLLLLILVPVALHAQPQPAGPPNPSSSGYARYKYIDAFGGYLYENRDTNWTPSTIAMVYWQNPGVDSSHWVFNGVRWSRFVGNSTRVGGSITSSADIDFNPGNNLDPGAWIKNTFYREKPPTITLSGGTTLKLTGASTVTQSMSINACRQSNTTNLVRITLHGSNGTNYPISFSNPAQNACTGTISQSVTFPSNVTTVFTDTVVTQSGLTAIATSTYGFAPQRGYGWVTDTTGIGVSGNQESAINGLTQELSTSRNFSFNSGAATGKFLVIYYTSSSGALNNIYLNGINASGAFNYTTRTLTYTNGYTDTIYIYWNTQAQTTPGYPVLTN